MSQNRFADVGINLTDDTFCGLYYGKQHHEDDTEHVLQRACDVGCIKFMVTGSDLNESKKAIGLAEKYPGQCYATVGVHPCSAKTFDKHPGGPSQLLQELEELAIHGKRLGLVTAFGEIGLDYDRLMLTEKTQQLQYFEAQLELAVKVQLPLFLHSRAAHEDFERLLKSRLPQLPKRGLVHSFTGTLKELDRLLALDLDIGINGCSMKTEENLEVVKSVPLERLQIETDGPWVCVFRRTVHREVFKPLFSIHCCSSICYQAFTQSTYVKLLMKCFKVRNTSLSCLSEIQRRCSAGPKIGQKGEVEQGRHGKRT